MSNTIILSVVIPAKAGIQKICGAAWIPGQARNDNWVSLSRLWNLELANGVCYV